MAEQESHPNPHKLADEPKLKYLGFVLVVVLYAASIAAKLFNFAKENSGPLKPAVNTAENTVTTVLGPIWGKFHYVPIELLKFLDRTIDKSVKRVHKRVPKSLKRVYRRAFKKAKKAPIAARSVMFDVKSAGMVETASGLAKTVYDKYEPVAKDIYSKYEPVTEQYAAHAWHFLNQYTLFNRAAKTVTPIASYYSEKYNQKVQDSAEKGSRMASRLPLVPTEKIARVLSNGNVETEKIDRVLSNGNVEPVVEAEVSQEEAVTT